jgi:hypothetical protein
VAGTVGNLFPSVATCLVALAITVAAKRVSHWRTSGIKEESMGKRVKKMVRVSVLGFIGDIGTAAVGGLLAA